MWSLFLILLLVGLAAPAAAQYKGRVIGGAAVAFDGDTLLVKPEGPGLGAEPDAQVIKDYRVA